MVNQHESPFYQEDAVACQRAHKRIVDSFPISRVYQAHIPSPIHPVIGCLVLQAKNIIH